MLPLKTRASYVLGSNTDVGKTLWATGATLAAVLDGRPTLYIKPCQTGHPQTSDERFVRTYALRAALAESSFLRPDLRTRVLYAWRTPVSPDLAARDEGSLVSDETIISSIAHAVQGFSGDLGGAAGSCVLVEGAGGVLSPAPSGNLQADVFRQYRMPVMLIGDAKLGGISTTLSSIESLQIRGFDVAAVCLFDETVPSFTSDTMHRLDEGLLSWFKKCRPTFSALHQHLEATHQSRIEHIEQMQRRSSEIFWWPFTQHSQTQPPMVIDSALGEKLHIAEPSFTICPKFDACGSWWTNGLGHGNPSMSKAVAAAIGRYGHVLFPNNTHDPAFRLADKLLKGVGSPWASRVFYSDNGSTAIEIALKMAFRKYAVDKDIKHEEMNSLVVVGLHGAYHGDTLGAMEAVAPSPFTARQHPWYSGRGVFFEPPCCSFGADKQWHVTVPTSFTRNPTSLSWSAPSLEALFASSAPESILQVYHQLIDDSLDKAVKEGMQPAALVIEPVLQGAGGMLFVDPSFHKMLAQICRRRGIPVIFDEVFVGFWRLGVESAGRDLLGFNPDISCHAKLLTGGSVPLAVTLTTEEVFSTFLGDKANALLHGHSYTANPAGCAAALHSLEFYETHKSSFALAGHWNP
eukprot:tig00021612_g22884.t1